MTQPGNSVGIDSDVVAIEPIAAITFDDRRRPSARRSRTMCPCSDLRADDGRCCGHNASSNTSTGTRSPTRAANAASTVRSARVKRTTEVPSIKSTGPRTRTSTTTDRTRRPAPRAATFPYRFIASALPHLATVDTATQRCPPNQEDTTMNTNHKIISSALAALAAGSAMIATSTAAGANSPQRWDICPAADTEPLCEIVRRPHQSVTDGSKVADLPAANGTAEQIDIPDYNCDEWRNPVIACPG